MFILTLLCGVCVHFLWVFLQTVKDLKLLLDYNITCTSILNQRSLLP